MRLSKPCFELRHSELKFHRRWCFQQSLCHWYLLQEMWFLAKKHNNKSLRTSISCPPQVEDASNLIAMYFTIQYSHLGHDWSRVILQQDHYKLIKRFVSNPPLLFFFLILFLAYCLQNWKMRCPLFRRYLTWHHLSSWVGLYLHKRKWKISLHHTHIAGTYIHRHPGDCWQITHHRNGYYYQGLILYKY